ncbi:MAG: putative zinc-binding metallopeptidase [Planctomycetota bacterium]|nr:putative zinc-binding metallopeptidase [Planctomycetota bacterium]
MKPENTRRPSRRSRVPADGGQASWARLADEELLDLRLCDLELEIKGTALERRIQELYGELEQRGLRFRPPCWLSSEWFAPDAVPGMAVPFYLAHPRLMKLEDRQMKEVEGGTKRWCMQLLRHEAAHAYETAYHLSRRHKWRRLFGSSSKPYPEYYSPEPFSRDYVLHLDWWYAQSHPCEDFAETFAVWLRPGSQWRRRYTGWPALTKLEYVDALMAETAEKPRPPRTRARVEPVHRIRKTLREHYKEKQERYGADYPDFYDLHLRRLFPRGTGDDRGKPASSFLRRAGPGLRRRIAFWTGEYAYTINLALKDMISRCRELDLRVTRQEEDLKLDTAVFLTMQTMNYLHSRDHRVAM